MLVAVVSGRRGLAWVMGVALLAVSGALGLSFFAAQAAAPDRFGCPLWGEDFATLHATAKIVVDKGGSEVYKLPRIEEASVARTLDKLRPSCGFTAWPVEYWLAFLVPMFPFTLLAPKLGYYLWTLLSVGLFAISVWRVAHHAGGSPWPYLLISLGFFPLVFGLLQGQVHGWQLLALTEFWLAMRRQAERAAGLWLSVQLVKPQFLLLIVLWLLRHRRWRAMGWFVAGGLMWLGLTLILASGQEGAEAYIDMVRRTLVDGKNSLALLMPNWRFLAFVLFGRDARIVLLWTVALSAATATLVVWAWRRRPEAAWKLEPQAILVLMVGALLVGYQTFVYSAVFLLPGVLALLDELSKEERDTRRLWSFVLDFALLSPTVAAGVFAFLFARGIYAPAVLSATVLTALAAILAMEVLVPVSSRTAAAVEPAAAAHS